MNKPRKKDASGERKAASGGWRLNDDRPPTFRGWISTDEGEIRRREWRGRTEIVDVHALDGSPNPFGDYRVTSSSGSSYTVEIRSLGTHINSCGCRDHRTNRLGTCKHIEGVLHRLRGNRAAPPRRPTPKGQESSGRMRMLELVRDYAVAAGIEFAWHTGSVAQPQRRAEIRRFRDDPECRLFLSSESGGVGLNLQVADTVVNMDQPWNPARLEQRIARAWRKHQTRPVTVINLVSEYTIEHRMLGLLDQKRTLAEGVLDQRGDLSEIPLPTGRAAFMERLDAVLGARADAAAAAAAESAAEGPARAPTAVEQLRDDLVAAHGATLRGLFVREGDEAVLVVLALPPERSAEEERRLAESTALNVKVIDPSTHESMLRLAEAGLIALPGGELREVWLASGAERSESDGRLVRAKALTDRAEHKLKAAVLLVGGGFAEEARAPAAEAARLAVAALAAMRAKPEPDDAESAAEFLLEEEPDGIPGGPPHDAIRALSGEEPADGEVAGIEEFVSRIAWMVADRSAPLPHR